MSKSAYIGVDTSIINYEWIDINASNIGTYFNITDGTYKFTRSGSTMTSNNKGIASSTATTSLNPKESIQGFSFDYSVSSESGYDLFYVTYGSSSSPSYIVDDVSGTVSNSYIRESSMSTTRYLTFNYKKDSSANSGNDQVIISNFKIRKLIGTSVKPIARKIKKMYIGVNNVARRVKKGYIGVNGIARLFYTLPPVERGSTIELTTYHTGSDTYFTAAGNSKYAIYNDRYKSGSYIHLIDTNGTVTTKTQTSYSGMGTCGCHFNSYGIYMGINGYSKYGFKINTSGTISTTYFSSGKAVEYMYSNGTGCGAGPLGTKYALFPGGAIEDSCSNYLDYMNTSGTWSYTTLSLRVDEAAVADNGTLAVIAGGQNSSGQRITTVNTFNTSGTRGTATALSTAVCYAAGARAGKLAIVAGGDNSSNNKVVSAYSYNTSGTRTILSNMRAGRAWHSGASGNGQYAIFMGNVNGSDDTASWYGDCYDSSGVKIDIGNLGYCVDIGSLAYVDNKVYCADFNDIHYDEFYLSTHIFNII